MKWTRFVQITILFFAVVTLFAGWYEESHPRKFNHAVEFDSTVTFNDSTFFRDAVVCSGTVKIEDKLTLELAIINQIVGWDDERKICLTGESPPDVGFYNNNVGGQYSFWENSEPFELAFKISNAKWDSTVWGRRDSIDIYNKLIFKADTNYVSAICEYRWQSGGERVGPYVQAIGTSNDRDPAYLGYFICDEGTYTKVLELHYDSVKIIKPLLIEDRITVSSVSGGQATFTRNTIVDTVVGVTGVSTNSKITVTAKMLVPLPISWTYLNTDSFLVHVLPADTVGQAVIYCWFRIE